MVVVLLVSALAVVVVVVVVVAVVVTVIITVILMTLPFPSNPTALDLLEMRYFQNEAYPLDSSVAAPNMVPDLGS